MNWKSILLVSNLLGLVCSVLNLIASRGDGSGREASSAAILCIACVVFICLGCLQQARTWLHSLAVAVLSYALGDLLSRLFVPALLLIVLVLLAGGIRAEAGDFVQGNIRITPPIKKSNIGRMKDGGTQSCKITDAKGRDFEVFVDHRLGTKTPGQIYLFAYPSRTNSVPIKNSTAFPQTLL